MTRPSFSIAWPVAAALLAGCGDTPDPKTPADIATVDVQPAAESADPPPAPPPEAPEPPERPGKKAPPPDDKMTSALAVPAAPAAPVAAPGPTAPSGGTATFTGASSTPAPDIQARAATDAAGMLPSGLTLSAKFKAGDTLELPLTLLPGRCYTILAGPASPATSIQAMDLSLQVSMPPLPPAAVAVSQGAGTRWASIGGKGTGCYKSPLPLAMPATVILRVTTGAGPASVQVYSK